MSLLKVLEKIVDVVTDSIINLDPIKRERRSLKYKQKAALDHLSECLCKEASYYTGRTITEEELIQKGKEFNARHKKRKEPVHICNGSNPNYNAGRTALAGSYAGRRNALPFSRK